jgi:protease I
MESKKRALLIIAPERFRDEEYFHTKEELENAGIAVITAATSLSVSPGMLGGSAIPDITLADARAADYDAIVFIGGGGSSIYFSDPLAHKLASDAYSEGKTLAAICIAPTILANASLLKGRKATAYSSEESSLRAGGAHFTGEALTVDGKLITANGPAAARAFGRAIADSLK